MISESSSLILPFHQEMDEIREDAAGKEKIGTTRRGIGPCYEDKVGRRSIRVMDLRSETNLDNRLENVLSHHNAIRKGLNKKVFEKDKLKKELLKIAPEILKFAQPVWLKLDQFHQDRKRGKQIGKSRRIQTKHEILSGLSFCFWHIWSQRINPCVIDAESLTMEVPNDPRVHGHSAMVQLFVGLYI